MLHSCTYEGCTYVYESSIPATGHTSTLVGDKEATYQEDGYTGDHVCSVCGKVLEKGETIPHLVDFIHWIALAIMVGVIGLSGAFLALKKRFSIPMAVAYALLGIGSIVLAFFGHCALRYSFCAVSALVAIGSIIYFYLKSKKTEAK